MIVIQWIQSPKADRHYFEPQKLRMYKLARLMGETRAWERAGKTNFGEWIDLRNLPDFNPHAAAER